MRALVGSIWLGALLGAASGVPALADSIRLALIEERSDPNAIEAAHGEQGFRLGLDYATDGTLAVRGRPITLVVLEHQGVADAADSLAAAYGEEQADMAVAIGSSEAALVMLPMAAARKRILLVAEAHASAIAGSNRYVFRTATSAGQQAEAEALALARPELNLFVAAEATRDGVDGVAALKQVLARHADNGFYVGTRLVPPGTADVGNLLSAEFDGLHDLHGGRTLLTIWHGAASPIPSIAAADPERFGIRLALAGALDPNAPPSEAAIEGITSYFYAFPRNPANNWLVATWSRRFRALPDGFAADGMTAAIAVVAALKAAPSAASERLVAAMEGMRFGTPKGDMVFRKEDHQALQVMYQFRCEPRKGGTPELEHEFSIAELASPGRPHRP